MSFSSLSNTCVVRPPITDQKKLAEINTILIYLDILEETYSKLIQDVRRMKNISVPKGTKNEELLKLKNKRLELNKEINTMYRLLSCVLDST